MKSKGKKCWRENPNSCLNLSAHPSHTPSVLQRLRVHPLIFNRLSSHTVSMLWHFPSPVGVFLTQRWVTNLSQNHQCPVWNKNPVRDTDQTVCCVTAVSTEHGSWIRFRFRFFDAINPARSFLSLPYMGHETITDAWRVVHPLIFNLLLWRLC